MKLGFSRLSPIATITALIKNGRRLSNLGARQRLDGGRAHEGGYLALPPCSTRTCLCPMSAWWLFKRRAFEEQRGGDWAPLVAR